jgi:predicted permease
MIDNLQVSFRVVAPLFLLMLTGYVLRRAKWLDEPTVQKMNKTSFRIFLPLMLFTNIINSSLETDFDIKIVLLAAGMSLFSSSYTALIAYIAEKDRPRRAALAQGMFRNNYILFGIPIMTSVFGEGAVGNITMLIACIIPINNILAVIEIQAFCGKSKGFGSIVKGVVTNPFVLAAASGFLVLMVDIKLPYVIDKAVSSLASIGNPLSLVLLGACLDFSQFKELRKDVVIAVAVKLMLVPLVAVCFFAAIGIRDEKLLALFIASATPAAASSHIMAGEMGADSNLAGHIVVFGTAFSVVTLFFWIFILKVLGLI